MKKVTIKDIVYILIIMILLVLLILSKLDFRFNILDKDNWVDIAAIIPSTLLSILLFKQAYELNKKQEKLEKELSKKDKELEIEIFNKQLDLELRERRLNIYCTFMSLGVINVRDNKKVLAINFLLGKHEGNEMIMNEIMNKEKEVTNAFCEAKLLFKEDNELLEYIYDIFNQYIEFRIETAKYIRTFYDSNEKGKIYLNSTGIIVTTEWIPYDLISTNPEEFEHVLQIFEDKYTTALEKEIKLRDLITNKKFIEVFDKYINIDKIGEI